jgi:tRNA pseudouridine13 synthase
MSGDSLPRGLGPALLSATIRSEPADFQVEEVAAFSPSGQGEHLLLEIEKTGMTTAVAARRIAEWAGVPQMAIGYAGMKDRHAVTRQRFSVHLPKRVAPDTGSLDGDGLQLIAADWHSRKLPRGALAGNRFRLLLRDIAWQPFGDRATLDARLARIASDGVPNYFGEQRFGRDGDNLEQARRMFGGARVRREERGVLLSSARSALFNQVLAARIEEGHWASGLDGEVWMLDGSHSVFGPQAPDAELAARAARQDIHPTGPLWGRGELRSAAAARAIEEATLAAAADLRAGLEAAGLKQERRALRMRVEALAWQWLADDRLELAFGLPPGAYATVLLRELGEVRDRMRPLRGNAETPEPSASSEQD